MLSTELPVSQVDVHRSEEEEEDRGQAGPPHGAHAILAHHITMENHPGSAPDAGRYGDGEEEPGGRRRRLEAGSQAGEEAEEIPAASSRPEEEESSL